MNNQDQVIIPWNGWRIVRRIGRGGFGTVYEIERDLFGKIEKAAMKVISVPESTEKLDDLYSSGLDFEGLTTWCTNKVESIVNEYMVMNRLKGKTNIVSCDDIEVVRHQNDPGADIFIRMELLTSLNKLISIIQKREEQLTDEEKEILRKLRPYHKEFTDEDVIRLGRDITQALEICEKNDIVHRDIKPENILISDDGDFKLGDFGTARKMEHTTAATFAGTERYMAPEVIKGGKTGKDVDTYALGLVVYRLLNRGRLPFYPLTGIPTAEETERAQQKRLAGEPFDPPVDGSPELKALVLKACAYDRKDRFASASEMLEKIDELEKAEAYRAESREDAGEEVLVDSVQQEDDEPVSDDAWNDEDDKTIGSRPIAVISASEPLSASVEAATENAYAAAEIETSDDSTLDRFTIYFPEHEYDFSEAEIGSYVYFGSYFQDNYYSNEKKEIEWLVLAREDDRILVISRYALDCQPYDTEQEDCTWENSTLKEWLNESFLEEAFDAGEQAMIPTEDKVFLLSITEAEEYFPSDKARECTPTPYAEGQGCYVAENGNCWWWLRSRLQSPKYNADLAAGVYDDGSIDSNGNYVDDYLGAVRPSLWIKIES